MTTRIHSKNQSRTYARRYAKLCSTGFRLRVPALGSRRRLQALRAIGYSISRLSKETGLSEIYIRQFCKGRHENIRREYAETIDRVYRTLCVQPLHNSASAKKARLYAQRNGWYPPMAWDDIDTDKTASLYPKRRH